MVADVAAELFDQPVLWYNPRATHDASMLSPAHDSKMAYKPIYILTSSGTFSGAEHFTYDLKMLKRATVIGETTRGGHPGAVYRIDDTSGWLSLKFGNLAPTESLIGRVLG
jgi:C-terminal processing protease CtpA/Prc